MQASLDLLTDHENQAGLMVIPCECSFEIRIQDSLLPACMTANVGWLLAGSWRLVGNHVELGNGKTGRALGLGCLHSLGKKAVPLT